MTEPPRPVKAIPQRRDARALAQTSHFWSKGECGKPVCGRRGLYHGGADAHQKNRVRDPDPPWCGEVPPRPAHRHGCDLRFLAKPPSQPAITRRTLLGAGALAITAVALQGAARGQASTDRPATGGGFRVIRVARGTAALRGPAEPATPIWGFDGAVPGPTLRAARGEEIKVRVVNELDEPTSVHWHGIRIANAMDGVAPLTQPPIAPGASFDYRFVVPDAGTFWYHAQVNVAQQVGRGLYGALIIDEAEPVDVDRDIALVLGDWRLAPAGTIVEATVAAPGSEPEGGRPRAHVTVNGLPALDIPVKTNERIRLRVVNAATARVLSFRLDRHRAIVMAIDGEPAEPFEARDSRFALGPGNRIDLFLDTTLEPGASAALFAQDGGEAAIARLVYDSGSPARPEPRPGWTPLPANPLPERMDFERALKLDMALATPGTGASLFSVKRGRTVTLGLVNRTTASYAMHLHGHHFRLLDRLDDGWKPFWLDTVVVPGGQTFRIAFVADNPGKWLIQGEALEQRAPPIAQWFEVQ